MEKYMSRIKTNMVYRLEQRIVNNRVMYYLVKDVKINGEKRKICKYVGNSKPTENDLSVLCKKYAYEIERRAIAKKVDLSSKFVKIKCLDKETINKLEFLRFAYKQLNKLLTENEIAVYDQDFEVNYVHGTTVIEGNTLSLKQTQDLLINGILPSDKKLREINEVQNFKSVKKYRDNYKGKVTLKFIKNLHALIMNNIDFNSAGYFRRMDDIGIAGCEIAVTPSELIEEELTALISNYYSAIEQGYNPFEEAALFHYNFEMIHPFTDGNGRVGRELFNYMLNEAGYPKLLFLGSERAEYIKMLHAGNEGKYSLMIFNFAHLLLKQRVNILINKLKEILNH
jgi:Fic family protein